LAASFLLKLKGIITTTCTRVQVNGTYPVPEGNVWRFINKMFTLP